MTIRTHFFPVAETPAELVSQIDAAYLKAFPTINAEGVGADGREWDFGRYRVICWLNDEWGAIAEILVRTIKVGDVEVRVGGVGGVMTLPEFRKQGLASAVMRHVSDAICQELRADAGMLYCDPDLLPFYSALGWYELQREIHYQQSNRNSVFDSRGHKDGCAMFKPCSDFVFPSGPIDIQGKLW
jgi:predicted N-acetyltransferase YhbS